MVKFLRSLCRFVYVCVEVPVVATYKVTKMAVTITADVIVYTAKAIWAGIVFTATSIRDGLVFFYNNPEQAAKNTCSFLWVCMCATSRFLWELLVYIATHTETEYVYSSDRGWQTETRIGPSRGVGRRYCA